MSMNSTVVHQQHEQPNIAVPHKQLSFLSLPIELRITIYEYLVPNDVVQYWGPTKGSFPDPSPIRHDQQPCCPAILRINRQIHDEAISVFYGTARFHIRISRRHCHFLGKQFCIDGLDGPNTVPNKLPPGFRFIRSLYIFVSMGWRWNLGVLGVQSTENSPLPPLSLPQYGASLIAECLSTGSYELRQVTLCELIPSTHVMPAVVDYALQDGGKLFRAVLKQYLAPLRILQGVNFKFDDIIKIGLPGGTTRRIIRDSEHLHSREEVLTVLARLERIRMRFLQKLAAQVSQHA